MRFLFRLFVLLLLLAGAAAVAAGWWLHRPLALRTPTVELAIEPGTLPRGVARAVQEAGVDVNADLL